MADTKISDLAAITTLDGTEEFVVADSGATKKITAANAIDPWTEVVKGSDESVSGSTTMQNDDELFFATVSGAVYELDILLIYASPAGGNTPDFKADFGEDATTRGGVVQVSAPNTGNTAVQFTSARTNQTDSVGHDTDSGGANRPARYIGAHVGGGGTFRVRWAQNTSNGNATILRAGSILRYRRIV